MRNYSLALICVCLSSVLYAQKAPKFGKIDESWVEMTSHPIDTAAEAIILEDFGSTSFRYDQDKGFVYVFETLVRIKILSKEGLDYGDFKIPFYQNNSDRERIGSIKGYTYNMVDGDVEQSKLEKSSIFREEESNNRGVVKISMPDVQVGSVVELIYTKTSPFTWSLTTWVFQSSIPTLRSEYRLSYPEYFDYQQLHSGYIPLSVNDKSFGSGNSGSLTYQEDRFRWVAENVPAFKAEPYVSSSSDYISKIEFELRGVQYPSRPYKQYMGTWASLNKTFLDSEGFYGVLKQTGYMKDEIEAIAASGAEKEDQVVAVIDLIKKQVKWNERYGTFASNGLRKPWNESLGSAAEINLMIVAGLRSLGFTADPVLISTRGHGMVREAFALSSQFNYVVGVVEVDGEQILLDGTDRYLPADVLPMRCLNGNGWRVSTNKPGWVSLSSKVIQETVTSGQFEIEDNILFGNLRVQEKGYNGFYSHKMYKLDGEEEYFEDVQDDNEDWEIIEYEFETSDDVSKPFVSKYEVEMSEDIVLTGDRIYFNPNLEEVMNENPFKLEKREYPVDYACGMREAYMFVFTIPDGYSVEELPQSTAFALPNKSGVFRYNVNAVGNKINFMADFRISKSLFTQVEYPVLKQFYDQVVAKCSEQVVLKKNT